MNKNKKQKLYGMAIVAILALSFIVLSCDEEEDDPPVVEQPQDWTDVTIDGISGLKISTVSGTQLTPTQMNTVKSKLKTAIEGVQGGSDTTAQAFLGVALGQQLVVELETTNTYNQYNSAGNKIRLNVNHALNTLNATSFASAIKAMYGDGPVQQ